MVIDISSHVIVSCFCFCSLALKNSGQRALPKMTESCTKIYQMHGQWLISLSVKVPDALYPCLCWASIQSWGY